MQLIDQFVAIQNLDKRLPFYVPDSPIDMENPRSRGKQGIGLISNASRSIREARRDSRGFNPLSVSEALNYGLILTSAGIQALIPAITDPNSDPSTRLRRFKEYNDLMDAFYNGVRKLDEVNGRNSQDVLKALEEFRVELRLHLISDLSELDPKPKKKWYKSRPEPLDQYRTREWFERILYNEIEDVNSSLRNTSAQELGSYTVLGGVEKKDSLEDFESNCAHCAPVTLATMYGARLRAGSRETEYSYTHRRSTREVFPEAYGSHWQATGDLDMLFDTIESSSWPDNTYAFVHWTYKNLPYSHITVVGKVNGRACIIEGQTQSIITRDSPGAFRETHKDKKANYASTYRMNSSQIENVQFMHVMPAQNETEFDRIDRAHSAMYPGHKKPQLKTNRGPNGLKGQRPPRQYHVPAPTVHKSENGQAPQKPPKQYHVPAPKPESGSISR